MPHDLPLWYAVYDQIRRWLAADVFNTIITELRELIQIAEGRSAHSTTVIFDSRTRQSTRKAATARVVTAPSAVRTARAIALWAHERSGYYPDTEDGRWRPLAPRVWSPAHVLASCLRIAACFVDLIDPRVAHCRRHSLLDLLTITLCAILGAADTMVEIESWGRSKREWLENWLVLPNGIPSHDTFGRVLARLDPVQLQAGLFTLARQLVVAAPPEDGTPVIALDGKTVRRSGDRVAGEAPLHVISAWATTQRIGLAQRVVDTHANEIGTLPDVLRQFCLTGRIITIDAIGCQTDLAQHIVDGGGDYVLALKANQEETFELVVDSFAIMDGPHQRAQSVEKDHGRMEWRVCEVIRDPAVLAWLDPDARWVGLQSIARVTATRQVIGQEPTTAVRYDLSSLPGDAGVIAWAERSHWGIENGLHWVLDMGFRKTRVGSGEATRRRT